MKKISDLIKKGFTISVEIVPPRNGMSTDEIMGRISHIKNYIDFVSVTKGAGGSLRGGSLPMSYYMQDKYGINTISHFVCRERTKQEIENDLVDLHEFKIRNILALRGDPPAGSKQEWDGDYKYAYLLVKQISEMNKGHYLPRSKDEEPNRKGVKTDFCILVAGHPEDSPQKEIVHIQQKVEAGAQAIITQMIFSFDEYKIYVEMLRKNKIKIPVIPGIRPLFHYDKIESVEKFFGLKVCDELKDGVKVHGEEFALRYYKDMILKLKKYKAPGIHFFIMNDVELIKKLFIDI